jgi:hypothetical protein
MEIAYIYIYIYIEYRFMMGSDIGLDGVKKIG